VSALSVIAACTIADVAARVGLHLARDSRHVYPCPACREERRARNDDRLGPVWISDHAWGCQRCGARGGAVALACWALVGARLAKGDPRWRDVLRLLEARGLADIEPAPPPPPAPRPRPAADELRALWAASVAPAADAEVAAWLRSRGLDPVAVGGLARALPPDVAAPRWASFRGHPWTAGWRLLLPSFAASGRAESFRARWVRPADDLPPGGEKASAASAGVGSASGLVLATPEARRLLSGSAPGPLVIVEGEPDFLTWATRWPGAVVGIWNGAWQPDLAARVPDGTRVVLRTHHDATGDAYAARIAATLAGRCQIERAPAAGPGDENDALRAGLLPGNPIPAAARAA
jgi:hypothetical protein